MKNKIQSILIFLSGCIITAFVILFVKGEWDFGINIIDLLMLIATIVLSVGVLYLTKSLDKKDIVRDLIAADLQSLIDLYKHNSDIFIKLQNGEIDLDTARKEVRMVFHKADLIIDCINEEVKESFPEFLKKVDDVDLLKLTSKYYKWVTGGDFFEDEKFKVLTEFVKNHETYLYNTLSSIKLITHKLVRFM